MPIPATSGEKSTAQTARDLGISVDTLYTWVRPFGPGKEGDPEPLSPPERSELIRLRRENQRPQEKRGMLTSMSRRGDCWDNAATESFFHSLKTE